MSVLDDFARMRLYRKQAAEFEWLADNALVPSVQRRYRNIARHYSELADREERADKARMAERLEQLRRKRQEAVARAPGTGVQLSGFANDNLAIGLLRLMQIYERARRRRTAQKRNSGLGEVKSAHAREGTGDKLDELNSVCTSSISKP